MNEKKRTKRRPKARKARNGLRILIVLILVLGMIGVGVLMLKEDEIEKTVKRYPMEYTDLICRYAGENGLEPAHVAAVILAESSYRADAVSSVNAQGLMQLLPSTAEWIAGKFDESYVEGCLFNPETNIKYGCWYLGFLMERYDGDKTCTSAAYHSGQGTVDKWLKDPAYSADGKTLLSIPGSNADTYVNRILEYYEKYDEIYSGQAAA